MSWIAFVYLSPSLPLHFDWKSFKASDHCFKLSFPFSVFKFRIKNQTDFNGVLQTVCSKSYFKRFSSVVCHYSANQWCFCSLSAAGGITLACQEDSLLPVGFSCLSLFQPRTTTASERNQWSLFRSEHFVLYTVPDLRVSQLETPAFSFLRFTDLLMLILLKSILICYVLSKKGGKLEAQN